MNYYIINISKEGVSANINGENGGKISITSRKNISIKQGDHCIIMKENVENNYIFIEYGEILEVDILQTNSKSNQESLYTYVYNRLEWIKPSIELNHIAFSLQKIYRHFLKPRKHLNRKYALISKADYITIISRDFFYARTAFGMFVNNLHKDHIINFIKYFIDNNPENFFFNRNYNKALNLLNDYINSHIIIPAYYLQASYRNLSSLNNTISNEDLGELSFSSRTQLSEEKRHRKDRIKPQVELIDQTLSSENLTLVTNPDQILSNANEIGNQDRFEIIFKNTAYPIFI